MKKKLATAALILTLGITALIATGAPYPRANDVTPVQNLERTIRLCWKDGAHPIVLKVPDLKDGETRVIAAEDERPLKVTRKGRELTVNTGEKDIVVVLPDEKTPLPAEGQKMVLVKTHDETGTQDGKKVVIIKEHTAMTSEPVSAPKLLQNSQLKSYDRLDPKTRSAVDEVLQELLDKGTVIAPGVWIDSAKGGDVRVEIRKEEKNN